MRAAVASKPRRHVTAKIYDKKGNLLSVGRNSYTKTHPLQAFHANRVGLAEQIYLHAEIAAIANCKDISKAHKIVVERFSKKGEPLIACPCPICADGISFTPIKQIEHT
jgi:tRNA(Arg) A34 adenosine deaminase TadA